jgi:hypothetical protein
VGAEIGKAVAGAKLLAGFGGLMIAIAALMLRPRRGGDNPNVRFNRESARRLLWREPDLASACSLGFSESAAAFSSFQAW